MTLRIFAILSLMLTVVSELSVEATNGNQQQQQQGYFQRSELNSRPQLMVAIYCGGHTKSGRSSSALYHNQYLDIDSRKWRTDRDASAYCSQDKKVVLNYCRKVYPNHDIRNIVESSRPYKIENWCRLGTTKRRCRTKLTVRPYRCLEGTFQSDALLVPEKCVFDHVHNKSLCEGPENWNKTAIENCQAKGMRVESFAMLQPCGLDVFAGVEFVCCPSDQSGSAETTTEGSNSFAQAANGIINQLHKHDDEKFNSIDLDSSKKHPDQSDSDDQSDSATESSAAEEDDEDDYDDDEDEYDDDSSSWKNGKPSSASGSSTTSTSTTTTTTTTTTTERPIEHYLSRFDVARERDDFRKAELAVESMYRDKISHVMKEWSQLDSRYEEMKKRDPEAAEQFKKKMTRQFQKAVEALEEEGAAQRHEVASMHAQRAMTIINRRKKSAMDCLTQALDRSPIRTRQVERCIVKLLKALERDRTHTLRQYKNLLSLNTHQALEEKKVILEHLVTLNRAANQSIAMLDRSPTLADKLKNKIISFWHQLRNIPLDEPIELNARESELRVMEKYEEEVAQQKIERERQRLAESEQQERKVDNKGLRDQVSQSESSDGGISSGSSDADKAPSAPVNAAAANQPAELATTTTKSPLSSTSAVPMPQHLPLQAMKDGQQLNMQASEQQQQGQGSEQTHYQIDSAGFSHLKADTPYHELSYSVKHEPLRSHVKLGYSTFLVASCAAVVLMAFLGVKYYGKNSSRAYRRQGFAEVGRHCPEEKTVQHMQFNGYENPAYKFFEAEA